MMDNSPPPPSAEERAAMAANGRLADTQAELAKSTYADNKALIDRYAPVYDQLLQSSVAQSKLTGEQGQMAFDDYKNIFRPAEADYVKSSQDWASAGRTEERAQGAAATVQGQFDAARDSNARQSAAMGISPDSGRSIQTGIDLQNAQALGKAGAINKSKQDSDVLGLTMKQNVANFGRNVHQTTLASSAATLQGNQVAQGNISGQIANTGAAVAPASSLMQGAVNTNNSTIGQGLQNRQMQVQADGNFMSGLGSLAGMGLKLGGFSDENMKENIKPVNEENVLAGLEKIPVKEYDYKGDAPVQGHAVGGMAQDWNKEFGEGVAPGGKMLNIASADDMSVVGMLHAGLVGLSKKVKRMEKGEGSEPTQKKQEGRYAGLQPLVV